MEIKHLKCSGLIGAEYNPRKLSDKQRTELKDSLTRFGFVDPVLVNINEERKNIIIGGHQRKSVWEEMGNTTIPCIELDLTLDQEKELNVRLNKSGGEFDMEMLADHFDQDELIDWGFDEVDFGEDLITLEAEEDGFEEPNEPPAEVDVVLGDIIEIGEHRLMCGDSTDSDAISNLLEGGKADMVFTDPPYLMDFQGGMTGNDKEGYKQGYNGKHDSIKNDKMSEEDGEDFLDAINSNIQLFCTGAFYISFYRLGMDKYFASMNRTGLQCRATIIWEKGNHTLSNSDYMSRYEPIFYGWINEHNFYGGNNGMDVWNIPRTQKNDLHPTMKPIPLCEKAINDGSQKNDIVLDLFLGSGSTMVAAEQLKRKCYGMELDPKYCQVIINRMHKLDDSLEIKINGDKYTPKPS